MTTEAPRKALSSRGLIFAVGAYGLWGFLPLYFLLLSPTSAVEIVAWRATLSLIFCGLLLAATRAFRPFLSLLRDREVMVMSLLAGMFIAINWTVYVYGTTNGFVIEAALGYFMNPIVSIGLGVVFLNERLRPGQWVAVGISVGAVLVLAVGYGQLPWIALALAFSFGLYGYVKNRMGSRVSAVAGLALETVWMLPIAAAVLIVVGAAEGISLGREGFLHGLLLSLAGVVTAVPLLFFAAATRRLPLSLMGFLQYLTPLIQFAFGVLVLLEPMPSERWVGFGLVWLALIWLSVEALLNRRRALSVRSGARTDTGPIEGV